MYIDSGERQPCGEAASVIIHPHERAKLANRLPATEPGHVAHTVLFCVEVLSIRNLVETLIDNHLIAV